MDPHPAVLHIGDRGAEPSAVRLRKVDGQARIADEGRGQARLLEPGRVKGVQGQQMVHRSRQRPGPARP